MKKVVCIVGKSGVGKTTIAEMLKELGHKSIDSYTTRPMRVEDEQGHVFVSQEEFDAIRDDLVAYTKFHGHEYGATRQQFEESDIYIIDPTGVEELSEKVGRDNFIVVYLHALDGVRFDRMKKERGAQSAFERIKHDEVKFSGFSKEIDYCLENNYPEDLKRVVKKIDYIINIQDVRPIE